MHHQYGILTRNTRRTNLHQSRVELQDMFVTTSTLEHDAIVIDWQTYTGSGFCGKLAKNNI